MDRFWNHLNADRSLITWHGVRLQQPNWSADSHSLAYSLQDEAGENLYHFMINAFWEPPAFELPALDPEKGKCHLMIDTSQSFPDDLVLNPKQPLDKKEYQVQERTIVIIKNK